MKKYIICGILLLSGFVYFAIRDYNATYVEVSSNPNQNIELQAKIAQNKLNLQKDAEFKKYIDSYKTVNASNYENSVISTTKPNVAVVVLQKDISATFTRNMVNALDSFVTIALQPQNLKADIVDFIRNKKHEILISIPMEPINFPDNNPGPLTLLTGLTFDENSKNLEKILNITNQSVGFINIDGGRFAVSKNDFLPVLERISSKKLFFVNASSYDNSITDSILQASSAISENFATLLPYDYLSEERLKELFTSVDTAIKSNPKKLHLVILYASGLSVKNLKSWIEVNKQNYNFITLSSYFLEKKRLDYENTKLEKTEKNKLPPSDAGNTR